MLGEATLLHPDDIQLSGRREFRFQKIFRAE
jgi:hypothetical protein